MIDTKYGLKYSMPHSIVHIVDNSSYTGPLPVVIADDPSLYSTIVVTGCPMGEDNRVVNINRSDVANVAYGLGNLTLDDRTKYGQCVEYTNSLISQGAPVRFMRVTPEDATYGLSCILVQWRIDETDNNMHVRFKEAEIPSDMILNRFKNSTRLSDALMKYNAFSRSVTDGDHTWNQRVFMTYVSAGRGKVYNNMAVAINSTTQSKRPANVQYEFVTIDTRTNAICERFYASLINTNSSDHVDAIDSVNVSVNKRVEASSIIIPRVNESAVKEIYNEYIKHFEKMLDGSSAADNAVFAAMNINIFDLIYGNYIYNGTDTAMKMPFYQVDMYDTDIPRLPVSNRILTDVSKFNPDERNSQPKELYTTLTPYTYGLTRDGDNVYVGDLYLNTTVSGTNLNPNITLVCSINQYTGAVTYLTIPKVYPITKSELGGGYAVTKTDASGNDTAVVIKTIFNDVSSKTAITSSKTLQSLVISGDLKKGDVVAYVENNTFELYTIESVSETSGVYTVSPAYTLKQIYQALAWNSHPNGDVGVGNIIGRTDNDAAYTRIGATVIDSEGNVYVNDYTYTADTPTQNRIEITKNTAKFGACPTDVEITTSIVGNEYDVIVYPTESLVERWDVEATINTAGTNYAVGDIVNITGAETTLTITEVNEGGAVVKFTVSQPIGGEPSDITGVGVTTSCAVDRDPAPSGLTVDITTTKRPDTYSGTPKEIIRYMVSGVQGSIFRLSKEYTQIKANYYSDDYGINMTSEVGGIRIKNGSTGFFDDESMNEIEFKWRYSALLVKAYRGELDPRIMSPNRVSAKFLFDAGHNTIVGQTILPYMTYTPNDVINASTIFTADEKDEIMYNPEIIANLSFEDIDVKQAMYDLMVYRCYQGIPEDKRPIGPGSGLSLHLDSGVTDANTALMVNTSFKKRFNNPNASWDIGGWVDSSSLITYTFTKRIVDNLVRHSKQYSINKPYVGKYTTITPDEYSSFFPDIDTTDWELRELLYNSGGNAWIPDINGNIIRRSQRTLSHDSETSDLIQESNMRTLSQLVYLLQNKIDSYLLEYNDDGVLKTLSDEVNNMFSNWVGNLVDALDIQFQRDINIDGGEIIVCYCNVTFRGLILRVPIIVNVNRRDS